MKWPEVSVVISTYKRPEFLRRALESLTKQTFEDFEVVVVDDGSDTAGDVCEKFRDRLTIQAMNLPENTGYQCTPKNIGIEYAHGTFIAYLDDDNEFDPEHLEILVNEIRKMGVDAVYSRWRYRGNGPGSGEDFPYHQMNKASALGLTQSPMANFIDSSSILHSKAAFAARLGRNLWNPDIRRFGDWEMVSRSLQRGLRWRGVDAVTFTYWWHGENLQLTRPLDEVTVRPTK